MADKTPPSDTPRDNRQQPHPPQQQQEPPRPHGDVLDRDVESERLGDMDRPEMNPTSEGAPDQD